MLTLRRLLVVSFPLALLAPGVLLAATAGSEFQANSYTTNDQRRAAVGVHPDGSFVVTWNSNPLPSPAPPSTGQDGDGTGVFGQRFDAAGNRVGAEFAVSGYTTGNEFQSAIAVDNSSGGFVAAWVGYRASDPDGGIFARRFDASGNPLGSEFQVNSYTTGAPFLPRVASDASGNFVVVWASPQDGGSGFYGNYGVFGQRFNASGSRIGGEFQVNSYTTGYQSYASVGMDTVGNFVVVWQSGYNDTNGPDGSYAGISAQRYDSAGNPLGGEFVVNSTTTIYQYRPSVAMDAAGNFVVVWNGYGASDPDYGVFGQRFDSSGGSVGGEFLVNTHMPGNQNSPRVTSDPSGNFLVVWNSPGQDGDSTGIFGQRFDSFGGPVGGEFQVSAYITGNQSLPAAAMNATGDAVVAWSSGPNIRPFTTPLAGTQQDRSRDGIFGQVCPATDTTPPSVAVRNPTGAVTLYDAYDYTIGWRAADNCSLSFFDVFVSLDGGVTYPITACAGLDSTQRSCTWFAGLPSTTKGRVKVVAYDSAGNTAQDASDSNFKVVSGTPSVTVTVPDLTGITWKAGLVKTIKWSHNFGKGEPVKLELSRNGGTSWEQIASAAPGSGATTGTFNWIVTPGNRNNPGTTQARIRASWAANTAIQDVNNNNFTIQSRVAVTQPNTAVAWKVGTTKTIKWTHGYGASQTFNVQIDRNFAGGPGPWETIATNVVGTTTGGSFAWVVSGPTTASARIRVMKAGDGPGNDVSNVDFSITP